MGDNGRAYCWGKNDVGQVGNGTTSTKVTVPTAVNLPSGVTAFTSISAGWRDNTCAIGSDQKVYCWGKGNPNGSGNGTKNGYTVPTLVPNPSGTLGALSISAGATSCAIYAK
jgi:alpha-tubulin suppressor-like RCC1 family protein